jgi:hypothetical protein
MTERNVEPDAVKITKPHISNCIEYDHLEGITLSEDSELEPLFSASTIQKIIKKTFKEIDEEGYGYPEDIEDKLLEVIRSDLQS